MLTLSGREVCAVLCPRLPNPGQAGSEETGKPGVTLSSQPPSAWDDQCPPPLRLLLRAPVLPKKMAPAGGSSCWGLRGPWALSSLKAAQSFKGPHPKEWGSDLAPQTPQSELEREKPYLPCLLLPDQLAATPPMHALKLLWGAGKVPSKLTAPRGM